MNRALRIIIIIIFVMNIMSALPIVRGEDSDLEWIETVQIHGTCSMDNVRTRFEVNRTVVEIIVNLTWSTGDGYSNLNMWVEDADGYVANASYSTQMPEVMRVRDFPNRGRWVFVVVPIACGSSGEANFTATLILRNIVLPNLDVNEMQIESEENVTLSLISPSENVSQYFFDFGDKTNSGWLNFSSISKIYETPGDYRPRGKVRYSDGTESDWVEGDYIEVKEKEQEVDLFLMASIFLIILMFTSFLALFLIKKRKGI